MAKRDVHTEVTDRVIALLDKGVVPWRKTWQFGAPRSLVTGRPYRGLNYFTLGLSEFDSPYWLTYEQARNRGGHVKRGEKGSSIIFWKMISIKDATTGEEAETFPVLRAWTVFNVLQCEGIAYPKAEMMNDPTGQQADAIVARMPNCPPILFGGDRAAYYPNQDIIRLPFRASYENLAEFCLTRFHELVHATGHSSRLDRAEVMAPEFGTDPYAKEELLAEMGASMLCGEAGIAIDSIIDNSAAYIGAWLKRLEGDKRLVVAAAAAAQRAVDYILNRPTDAQPAQESDEQQPETTNAD